MPESLLPQVVVAVNGKRAKALVDTGCTTMLVKTGVAEQYQRSRWQGGEVLWRERSQNRGEEYTTRDPSNCTG